MLYKQAWTELKEYLTQERWLPVDEPIRKNLLTKNERAREQMGNCSLKELKYGTNISLVTHGNSCLGHLVRGGKLNGVNSEIP